MKTVSRTEINTMLQRLQGARSLRVWGKSIGLSAAYLSDLLRGVGERDEAFTLVHGRGDEAKHGGAPDPREKKPMPASRDIYVRDLRPGIPKGIKVPTRDFR